MTRKLMQWLAGGLLAFAVEALAGNVAPLGLEVGVTDLSAVKKALGGQTRLRDEGVNKWTGGPMLKSNGDGLDVEGLQEIVFIFGKDNRLDGVVMTMDKGRLKEVAAALRKKYKVVRENIPFVGNASATYRQGESVARIEAPHLSFSMEVQYLSNRLQAAFNEGSATEEAERRRRQAEKF